MTAEQFRSAVVIAKADVQIFAESHSTDMFLGYGLDGFKPVTVSIESVARLIRYQCACLYGGWDQEELDSIKYFGRKRFNIIEMDA